MELKKGDLVALIAPAGQLSDKSVVFDAQNLLEQWGLKAIIGKNALQKQGYFAGTDEQRLYDLQMALDTPEIKMIWALRGGYGTNRIIDKLDFSEFKKHPKIVAGYSDITVLHSKLNQINIPSYHIFMPVNIKENIDKNVIELTRKAIFGENFSYHFQASNYNKNIKKIIGIPVGGNLAILYSMLGTDLDIDTNNKILFIEDVGEQLYQIDRMIISLKKAGKLDNLKALMVGQFTQIPENEPYFGKNYQEIILEHTKSFDYPIIFDVPTGHITNNYPIIFGKEILIQKDKDDIIISQ